ncbi:DNA-binding transcriptional response regulator [Anaeromyxobacter paludicola]|uniref:Response regulatory domain-containing protein n=1 Tax=Anaeromyxobacter paludicola TaxID=2918171 RepID=A0ABN6N833_9BACT|nr:hypothetical protein [Anaeromyxobacter paludicola]BDG09380.1 hypothetical protein AMPC_24930 [Anaeromyxobacter paludicola]
MPCLLVYAEDAELRSSLRELLALEGHEVLAPATPAEARAGLARPALAALVVDLDDGGPAEALVRDARRERPGLRVITLSGALEPVLLGDVRLSHPCRPGELLAAVAALGPATSPARS